MDTQLTNQPVSQASRLNWKWRIFHLWNREWQPTGESTEGLTIEALSNIIGNGIEHTAEGGTIRILSTVNLMYWQIIIEDNGSGIKEEDIDHVLIASIGGRPPVRIRWVLAYHTKRIINQQKGLIKVESQGRAIHPVYYSFLKMYFRRLKWNSLLLLIANTILFMWAWRVKPFPQMRLSIILLSFLNEHPAMEVMYSLDWHQPTNKSFKVNGGIWPVHLCSKRTWAQELDPRFDHLNRKPSKTLSRTSTSRVRNDEVEGILQPISCKEEYGRHVEWGRGLVCHGRGYCQRVLCAGNNPWTGSIGEESGTVLKDGL